MKYFKASLIAATLFNFHPAKCGPDEDLNSSDALSQGTQPTVPFPDDWSATNVQKSTMLFDSPKSLPLRRETPELTPQSSPPPPPHPGRRADGTTGLTRQNAGFWNPELETFDQWHQRLLVPHPMGPGNRGAIIS